MAEKRMFSKSIVDSDMFLDMPSTAQALYFHLGMRADDEGFINNPKSIMRNVRCTEDDMKILIAKSYIIPFDSGVVVIRHWKINNNVRKDRIKPTCYLNEKSLLSLDNTDVYNLSTKCQPSDNQVTTKCQPSDGQLPAKCPPSIDIDIDIDIDKSSIAEEASAEPYEKVYKYYQDNIRVITSMKEHELLISLIEDYGVEWVLKAIEEATLSNGRSIKYINAILERWKDVGNEKPWLVKKQRRNNGKSKRDSEEGESQEEWLKRMSEEFGFTGS